MNEKIQVVKEYLKRLNAEWKLGLSTEHTFRPMLKDLVTELIPGVKVINEPSRIECGAPDYILIDKSSLTLGFLEAKDINDGDLDGRGIHKEQFDRYKASLDTIVFTDYLDFHLYECGEFRDSVRIGEVKGEKIVSAAESEIDRFLALIALLASARPQKITSPQRLAALMAAKAKLLARAINEALKRDESGMSELAQQMNTFRTYLIHDLNPEQFADIYAQTITYGMFAARLHDETPEDFSRHEAASLIPKTNPLLRKMFNYIAMDTEDAIDWIIDDLVQLFAATDIGSVMKNYGEESSKTDPILHFYEDFLAAYNPALRKSRGVWYTPEPVVNFIVRSVDQILIKDFGLSGGLADNSKVKVKVKNDLKVTNRDKDFVEKEVHRVQILDPAAGTGTFLASAVRHIRSKFVGMEGMWQDYVAEHLLPRLNGFEILMASYAMAHLKLDMLLKETGYEHMSNERLRVFLTNSLEEFDRDTGTLFAAALSQEANEANYLKRDCPVMVVIGNPPYSGESQNKGAWITGLMEDYKKEPGGAERLNEKNPKWINDDYVKFIRLAQHFVGKNGEGVLAYINPHGYLDNPTFRGMRWNLLKTFDEIYVVNLHGNSKKKETAPDGSKDENVFDITQGVSINIFVKKPKDLNTEKQRHRGLGRVHYCDVYGLREGKYQWLDEHNLDNVEWKDIELHEPQYFMVPKDFGLQEEYDKGFRVDELMPQNSMGITTGNDKVLVSASKTDIVGAVRNCYNLEIEPNLLRTYSYRPFDKCFILYKPELMARPREKFMRKIGDDALMLNLIKVRSRDESFPVFVTDKITDKTILSSKDNANVFPLYLYEEFNGKVEKRVNFNAEIYDKICASLGEKPTPEEVFNYIYAVLHTPSYREKYKEFLKIDFPRIPYPTDLAEFKRLAAIGEELVQVHLMKSPKVNDMFSPYARFGVTGDNLVDKVTFADGKVFINKTQFFDKVPQTAWNMMIGGYQPAQKWLKDRKGRVLNFDDIAHYRGIISALLETARLTTLLA